MEFSNSNLLDTTFGMGDCATLPLAMAYVPFQPWETPYEAEVALKRGTIFPSLDLPFMGGEEAFSNVFGK